MIRFIRCWKWSVWNFRNLNNSIKIRLIHDNPESVINNIYEHRRSQFFMNLIICGFRRIHVIISIKKGNDIAHFGRESLSLLYAFVQRPLGTKPHCVVTTRRGCSLQEGILRGYIIGSSGNTHRKRFYTYLHIRGLAHQPILISLNHTG